MTPVRVLVVDDHALFRDGLRALLQTESDFVLSGEASSGEEAVQLAVALEPEIILMDIKLPGINGLEATREILRRRPKIHVLIVSMFDDDASVLAAMQAGARGYLLKGSTHAELVRALQAVANGEAIFSPVIATRLPRYFAKLPAPFAPQVFPELTRREREILHFLAQGASNQNIAGKLALQPKTVRNHISNILAKLQVADRNEAAKKAREEGL
jgi:DNA-binding NarL/FixJ family response regulator